MTPLVLALALATPAQPPVSFTATGTGDDAPTGALAAISLSTGALLKTSDGEKAVKGLVGLRRPDTPLPAIPVGAQLITAAGDRIPGTVRGGDTKTLQFRPSASGDDWPIEQPDRAVAAVWLAAPPADTPLNPVDYTWLAGTPPRDVLLYRNGDAVRGALNGFTAAGVLFAPDGGTAREVDRKDLAAIGFNPRFSRTRKPKGPYAHLVLTDGTRLDVTEPAVKGNTLLVAKAACGPQNKNEQPKNKNEPKELIVEIPLSKIVALTVFQGPATYLSDLKPKKAEVAGFLGEGWPWVADRSVRGQPLRLLTKDGESTFDKGLGTHAKTVLVYDLAGKFNRFEALVGLDAATGKRGRADVRVLLDGKDVGPAELKALAAGNSIPVRLDVRGAKELTLVVDFGPTGDVQADVDWGDARLVE